MQTTTQRSTRPHHRWQARLGAALLAILAAAGCGDGGTPPETPTITVAMASSAASIHQGQSGTVTVNLTRGGGYNGAVSLALQGAPAGITATFQPASLANGVASSTLTLAVGATAPAGTHTLTVRATGQGVAAHTATLTLTVTVPPGIAVALSPTELTVTQGADGSSTLTITRTGGYAGAVELVVEGLPAGVTGTLAPSTVPAGSTTSTLTLTAAADAAPGTSTVTVRGAGEGVAPQSATLALNVAVPPGLTLSLSPTELSVVPGTGSSTTTVMITRTGGFAGPVTLAAENLPAGVTATFEPATIPVQGSASTLTLTAAAGAALGSTDITVRATGEGIAAQTVTLALAVSPAPEYTLRFDPNAVTVQQNGEVSVAINLERTGGFDGLVEVDVGPLAPGLQTLVSLTPQSTTGNRVTMEMTVLYGTPPGTYDFAIVGKAQGMANRTAVLPVTVTAAPGFTLGVTPSPVVVQQGGTVNVAVTITRHGGFTGAVNLDVGNAPPGFTAATSFTPNPATGNQATLNLEVGAATPPVTYNLTVTGTGPGVGTRSVGLPVQVQAVGGGGTTVTWTVCDESAAPIWVGYQSDEGPWARITAANGSYTFNVGARGGVAIVDTDYSTQVIYGTAAELNALGGASCALGGSGSKRLTGTLAGVGMTDIVQVQIGSASVRVLPGSPTFTLARVPAGPQDLIATRSAMGSGEAPSLAVNRFLIRRGLNLPDNSAIPVLDFEASEAFAPVERSLSVTGLGSDRASVTASYVTANSGTSLFGALFGYALDMPSTAATRPYFGVPAARQAPGDLHMLFGMALPAGAELSFDTFRGAISYFREAADRTLALGPALSIPTVAAFGTLPYAQLRAQFARQGEYDRYAMARFSQDTREVTVAATAAYFGNGFTTWNLAVPDLTAAAGFNPIWGLQRGLETDWSTSAYGWSGNGLVFLSPSEGSLVRLAQRSGTLLPW